MYHIQEYLRNTGKCVTVNVLLQFKKGRRPSELNVTLMKTLVIIQYCQLKGKKTI